MDDDADCTNCGDPYQLDGREPAAHGMCYQCASDHIPVLNAKVSALELQVEEYRKALEFCTGFKGSCPEGSRVAREVLERFTEKPLSDLGLDLATYEAAKKEQGEGKRVLIDDVIKRIDERK